MIGLLPNGVIVFDALIVPVLMIDETLLVEAMLTAVAMPPWGPETLAVMEPEPDKLLFTSTA